MAEKDKDTVEKDLTNATPAAAGAAGHDVDADDAPATTESVSAPLDNDAKSPSVKARIKLGEKAKLHFLFAMRHPFMNDGKGQEFDKDDVVTVEVDSWLIHQIDTRLVEVVK